MRVLVARAGALGDLVLLGPALHDLRAAGCRVTLLAPARVAAPLAAAGLAGGVLDWESRAGAQLLAGTAPEDWRREIEGCETALAYTRSAALLSALCRHRLRVVGHDPRPAPGVHAAEWLREPLVELGVARAPGPLPAWSTAELEAPAARLLEELGGPGFLSVHMGSGSPRKNWPAARFEELAAGLAEGRPWLHVSGPAETGAADPSPGPSRRVHARHLPLAQLAALLARAGLHVGNDAGVSHLAAAVGAPTLALFGPTDPGAWAPVGRAVRALRAPGGAVEDLQVEPVRRAALELRSGARALPCG